MSTTPLQMPSPCATEFSRDDSVVSEGKPMPSAVKMLRIHSLLNSSDNDREDDVSTSPPPTPAYTACSSPTPSTVRPQTPATATPMKREKLIKDAAIYALGVPKQPVNYVPFECNEDAICLSVVDQQELARQHEVFEIFPRGCEGQGLIADYQRHIPYSSEKKTFLTKTNRDAFEIFQYEFRMPNDPERRKHTVMWDYQIGLVRITPFFKALKYSKTTPAKALTTNAGLKELSHSITGGALAAQGYWMPYSCARAICLTFCYPIRWALTPVFGPSFLKECLRPEHSGFGKFKIDSEVIRCAQLEADGLRSIDNSRCASPVTLSKSTAKDIPRSVPPTLKLLPPKREQPAFKLGSPFSESESERGDRNYAHTRAGPESPELSPKTLRSNDMTWTSVNDRKLPPPPANTPVGSFSHALLTTPRALQPQTTSWRALDEALTAPKLMATTPSTKRGISATSTTSNELSESDDGDIKVPVKRQRTRSSTPRNAKLGRATKYTPSDVQAAKWLLKLSAGNAQSVGGS